MKAVVVGTMYPHQEREHYLIQIRDVIVARYYTLPGILKVQKEHAEHLPQILQALGHSKGVEVLNTAYHNIEWT